MHQKKDKVKNLKAGDYVKVTAAVHDEAMPRGRRDCIVLEVIGEKSDQVRVLFHNGSILKFHISQITIL